jgi:hypothetical protein
MLSFLAEVCEEAVAGTPDGVEHKQQRAVCAWAMASMIYIMDVSPRFLSPDQISAFSKSWRAFAASYQSLAATAQAEKRTQWKFRPKLHDLAHQCLLVERYGINPRHRSCFSDEDLMGKVAKTGRLTHRSTLCLSLLRRHMLTLCVRWSERARTHAWQVP